MAKRRPKNSVPNATQPSRLIQSDDFPFEFLSSVAERESWRKEIYRPIYHIHKWWAKRLGSIFRGIILGCLLLQDADLTKAFYEPHDFSGVTVFDPFLGSGTTVGEAHKLGCTALGRDINPVACESVRVALGPLDGKQLTMAFEQLSDTVGQRIRDLYRSPDDKGRLRDVLYLFWVKQAACPHCDAAVDLFPTRIFARNAYPDRKPEVQVCCPQCGDIFAANNGDDRTDCPSCSLTFDPHQGTAAGTKAKCPGCTQRFAIAEAIRGAEGPPAHRLYAKLLLFPDGTKRYLPATEADHRAYRECGQLLEAELQRGAIRLPTATLSDGYNTRQAIGYNYRRWRDFFNDRQLLALGWLQEAIAELPDPVSRDALFALFSGVLEFNNEQDPRKPMKPSQALEQTAKLAQDKLIRLRRLGLVLSQNDCRVTVVSQFLALLGPVPSPQVAVHAVTSCQPGLEEIAAVAFLNTDEHASAPTFAHTERQLTLFASPE